MSGEESIQNQKYQRQRQPEQRPECAHLMMLAGVRPIFRPASGPPARGFPFWLCLVDVH
jgi:hypothetical protein